MGIPMNRRGFLTGMGALLATTALVKPAAPAVEVMTNTMGPGDVSWVSARSLLDDLMKIQPFHDDHIIGWPSVPLHRGEIGEYLGITFTEERPTLEARDLDVARDVRRFRRWASR
jgi:hypothetical protein